MNISLFSIKHKVSVLLAVIAIALVFSLVYINVVQDYTLLDTYYESDGTRVTQKYYVRKKQGQYGLYDKSGKPVEKNR